MDQTAFTDAVRETTSFLAPFERRALPWMAARLPARINSDHLTLLALMAMLMAGLSYWAARWNPAALLIVNAWLVVNWFGDSLDGTLARVRRRQRPRYGFYVDHVLDAFGILFLVAGMAASGFMGLPVALGLLVSYFLLSIEIYLATYCLGRFHMSFWKFGPTELRLLLMLGNVVLLVHPGSTILGATYRLLDVAGVVTSAGLMIATLVSAAANTRALYRAEPLPGLK